MKSVMVRGKKVRVAGIGPRPVTTEVVFEAESAAKVAGVSLMEVVAQRDAAVEWLGRIRDGLVKVEQQDHFADMLTHMHALRALVQSVVDSDDCGQAMLRELGTTSEHMDEEDLLPVETAMGMLVDNAEVACFRRTFAGVSFSHWDRQSVREMIEAHGATRSKGLGIDGYELRVVDFDTNQTFWFATKEKK